MQTCIPLFLFCTRKQAAQAAPLVMRFTKSAAFFLALAAHTIGKTCSALLFIHLSGVCARTSGRQAERPAALWDILLALKALLTAL